MGEMYRRYERRRFADWKRKVKKRIPDLVHRFYSVPYRPPEDHVELGKVIHWINSGSYSYIGTDGKHTDEMSETTLQVCLEILVKSIFKTVYSKN